MPNQKYLCIYRSVPARAEAPSPARAEAPSPVQMQEMFAAFNAWKEQFKDNILDLGGRLKPSGRVWTASGVTDGPFVEAKEIVVGFMILSAESYERAIVVVEAMPKTPGARLEIREIPRCSARSRRGGRAACPRIRARGSTASPTTT